MNASTTLQIWRHQWLRVLRFGSPAEIVLATLLRGGTLIGTSLFAFVFLVVMPEETGQDLGTEVLAPFARAFLVPLGIGVVLINAWFSPTRSNDMARYRYYPVPLGSITLTLQVLRAAHVRYLALGVAFATALTLVTGRPGVSPLVLIVLFMVLMDSTTVLLQELAARRLGLFVMANAALIAAAAFDLAGPHALSGIVFDVWTRGNALSTTLTAVGATALVVVFAHLHLRTYLRYAS